MSPQKVVTVVVFALTLFLLCWLGLGALYLISMLIEVL